MHFEVFVEETGKTDTFTGLFFVGVWFFLWNVTF